MYPGASQGAWHTGGVGEVFVEGPQLGSSQWESYPALAEGALPRGCLGGEPRQEGTASAAHKVCLCLHSWNPIYAHPVRTSWLSPSSVPQGQWAQVQKIVPLGTGVPSEPDILGYPTLLWLDHVFEANNPARFKAVFFLIHFY